MSHDLEIINGQAQMAYVAGEVPWHGLGVPVSNDLTPQQMLEAAGLNWGVKTLKCYADIKGKRTAIDKLALVRDSDDKILDIISPDWKPMQNEAAFEFFNDFVAAGDMSMETAGSLKGGRLVWALARVKESFELFNGKDRIDSYLLFTNPHSYGQSIDVRFTHERVVCRNTHVIAMRNKKNFTKVNHRREFDGDKVKETLGIAKEKLGEYREAAEFLSKKRFNDEDIVEYFTRIFPVTSAKKDKKLSRNAKLAIEEVIHKQPGAELGEGTWWQGVNTITYMVDHMIGHNADTRLQSAWYGSNQKLKETALELALEYASKS